jgi:peptidoglycan/LPS O-acetylase OafA/YrhL
VKKEFSIYLDLVRFAAALLVAVWHSNNRSLVAESVPLSAYGHSAVIVFFVLSGFVIAFVTDTKERTVRDYAVSRMARIYSVAPAALILALVLDQLGQAIGPEFYGGGLTTHDHFLLRFVTSSLFLNELWGLSIMSYSNVPYWSLNYEVWYYVLFALAVFASGRRRIALIAAVCLLLGPKILLLFPIWWLGVWLYRNPPVGLGEGAGWALFLGSSAGILLFHRLAIDAQVSWWLKGQIGVSLWTQLSFSRYFLTDYLLGPLIALNFVGFRLISHRFAGVFALAGGTIRWLAGFTFSLYLFHQPLILFFAALIDGDPQGWLFYWQTMACVLVSVAVLGGLTERRKGLYRRLAGLAVDRAVRAWGLMRGPVPVGER